MPAPGPLPCDVLRERTKIICYFIRTILKVHVPDSLHHVGVSFYAYLASAALLAVHIHGRHACWVLE